MTSPPSESEVANQFGVQILLPLGGRLNLHWLARSNGHLFVLRRWSPLHATTIDYELRLLDQIAALGWPVAPSIDEPIESQDHFWTLFPFLPGEPSLSEDPATEQRKRGRLLARFHADLSTLSGFGQRGTWRRCEEVLCDQTLDCVLSQNEAKHPEEIRILRWHLDRARTRLARLTPHLWPSIIVHGDFAPWNIHFQNGHLSAILDFELAHLDHRIADFALSWRGKYDEIIFGYDEVSPLADQECELLTPLWWTFLLQQACHVLQKEGRVDAHQTSPTLSFDGRRRRRIPLGDGANRNGTPLPLVAHMSVVGAALLALLGVGLGLVSLSVAYMGSFRGTGLAREDSLFVTASAIGSLICIAGAIYLFASIFKQPKA